MVDRGAEQSVAAQSKAFGMSSGVAMIQNLGVGFHNIAVSDSGEQLLLKALQGFRQEGDRRVSLEVTARNLRAVRLYHQTGFIVQKTLYRELSH